MELPKYIHQSYEDLPKTLASRISYIRNGRRIHLAELSLQAKVPIKLLEDIEAGIETWLPTAMRQRIARVLKVDPIILEEVEVKNELYEDLPKDPPLELIERIEEDILSDKKDLNCPVCGSPLRAWIQKGLDLNEEPTRSAKAHCTKCVFQLRTN